MSDSRTNEPPAIISGELLKDRKYIKNKNRDPFDPFETDVLFTPLFPYVQTPSPISKPAKQLVDFFYWIKDSPFGHCFVVSQKLKEIFDQFNLQKHNYYKAELLHDNQILKNYYVLQLLELPINKLINFKDRTFENSKRRPKKFKQIQKEEIVAMDWDDLMNKIREKGWIYYNIRNLAVKDEFWKIDFMIFDKYGLLISEDLAMVISENKIAGVTIDKADFNYLH